MDKPKDVFDAKTAKWLDSFMMASTVTQDETSNVHLVEILQNPPVLELPNWFA